MRFAWEVAHFCLAVSDLERAVERYSVLFGARWTPIVQVDDKWVSPLAADGLERVRGRGIWAMDPTPPVELFEGAEGSPWFVPSDDRLDHVAYWAEDLDRQAQLLQEAGYRLEYTMPPFEDGHLHGFGYLRHAGGARIELQPAADRPAIEQWMAGVP